MTDQPNTVAPAPAARQQDDELWEYADVVAYTKLSEATIRRRVADESIPHRRIGRNVRFVPDAIRAWIHQLPGADA
jgi:excisionase family DNA binding protein